MTSYDVDLDELRRAIDLLAGCQRGLLALAADLDSTQEQLRMSWLGRAADAQESSYASWRGGCVDMVGALCDLRSIATSADEHYSRAVDANLARWHDVSA